MRISSECLEDIPRTWFLGIGYEKFLGIAVDIFTGFSLKDSWEFPRIFRKIVPWVEFRNLSHDQTKR